jgi:transcription initiation factor TFIIIB Brf1 subunit/transcription initiation factor TFIIB
MKCQLCGSRHFVEHVSGEIVCVGCGAVQGGPPEWPVGDDDRLDAIDLERDMRDEQTIEQYEWR